VTRAPCKTCGGTGIDPDRFLEDCRACAMPEFRRVRVWPYRAPSPDVTASLAFSASREGRVS
jgi:hypothetical protein